jgi:uncharacterized RDD family membrane protein YckC
VDGRLLTVIPESAHDRADRHVDGSETELRDAAADDEIVALTQRLLASYQEALDAAHRSPLVRLIPFRSTGVGRHVRLPRLRLFLGYFVVLHVGRSVGALKRSMHRSAVLANDTRRFENEITLLERFEQSLPGIPSRWLLAGLGALVLLVSYGAARMLGGSDDDLAPFAAVISGVGQLSRGDVTDALGEYGWYTAYFTALGIAVSMWLVLLLPMTSFQLKRTVFNLVPGVEEKLERTTLAENRPPLHGVYEVEEEIFRKLGGKPPRELRFDLALESVLIVLTIGVFAYTVVDLVQAGDARQLQGSTLRLLGSILLVGLLVLRLAGLAEAARARQQPTARAPVQTLGTPVAFAELEPAGWFRRVLASLVDVTAMLIIGLLLFIPEDVLENVAGENLAIALWYLFLFTVVPAVYTLPWLYWGARDRGLRTLGKRLVGLSVIAADGTQPTRRMALVREVGGKALLFGIVTGWLIVPWLLNYLWPLWDERHRALHDRLAGTIVVRARKAEATEEIAVPVSA